MNVLGIDIGGSGIKGAPIDTTSGALLAERVRIATPEPSAPEPVAEVIAQIASDGFLHNLQTRRRTRL